jgi:hypothetical protein
MSLQLQGLPLFTWQSRGAADGHEKELDKVRARIESGSLAGPDKIGVRVVNKLANRFALAIEDHGFRLY